MIFLVFSSKHGSPATGFFGTFIITYKDNIPVLNKLACIPDILIKLIYLNETHLSSAFFVSSKRNINLHYLNEELDGCF